MYGRIWQLAIVLQEKGLLVGGWMVFPMGVCAWTIVGDTLIALMSAITLGFLHSTSITGSRNALMLPPCG
jgi:hypothetical protein